MKVNAKRRRTKQEIREEKLAEAYRQREIEIKLQDYDAMKLRLSQAQEPSDEDRAHHNEAKAAFKFLKETGLLKQVD